MKKADIKVPFVLKLPETISKYYPILDTTNSYKLKSALVKLLPGEDVGSHNTGKHEELILVLYGIGEVESEGLIKQKINKNNLIYIPPNTIHNIHNTGKVPLSYIYIVTTTE